MTIGVDSHAPEYTLDRCMYSGTAIAEPSGRNGAPSLSWPTSSGASGLLMNGNSDEASTPVHAFATSTFARAQ